jgi:hypothetical protein
MEVKREDFLSDLEAVKAGLSPREFVEQSSCFVFQNGWVMTFNDEVACRKKVGIDVTGAVQSSALLTILQKIQDEDLKVRENADHELEFRGKGKGFGIVMDAEIYLPIDQVEKPSEWFKLPTSFAGALDLVQHCVSKDENSFLLTCVHIHPDYIEACDNLQIMRVACKDVVEEPILVRGSSLLQILSLRMSKVALTKSWIHFTNPDGLIFSCRRYDEEYPDLATLLDFKGHPVTIPKGVKDAAERAEIFAVDKSGEPLVHVTLADDRICITGDGLSGWYRELRRINYQGQKLEFLIAPQLLKHISENLNDASISAKKLKVVGQMAECHWEYATVLGQPRVREVRTPETEPTAIATRAKSQHESTRALTP